MSAGRMQLKRSTGWFAAGHEVQCAATLLSDAAFKLFLWVCLHAGRASGSLKASASELARALRKTESEIEGSIAELIQTGVCRLLGKGTIEIQDRFWPYERERPETIVNSETYIAEVRRMFLRWPCVQSVFTAADEKLATDWSRRGIPLQQVERAILLGTIRKYVALINHQGGTPITSLHYFSELIDEAASPEIPAGYWGYLEYRIKDFERRWRQICHPAQSVPARAKETK
jgi:hypothetical protein